MKIRKNESVEQGVAPYGAQGAPPVNADVGEKTMKPTSISIRLLPVIVLTVLFVISPGCTCLNTPVEMTQADIDYFRSEALRMVTDGCVIERDNGKTLTIYSAGEYDAKKPISYRILSSKSPRITVRIPMIKQSGGEVQELEFDVLTRQFVEGRIEIWQY